MNPLETAEIGTKGVRVTWMGLGGFGLGGASPDEPWQDVSDHEAESILERAWELGIRYYDTAANYGRGVSERRVGSALSKLPRDEFVISTKVGKLLNPAPPDKVGTIPGAGPQDLQVVFDFSRDGVLRSVEESLRRLGLDSVDMLLIHDPDDHYQQAMEGAYVALDELRSQGVVRALGAGMNQWQMEARFVRDGVFDCFILAGRYTLLEQTALAEFLPLCQEQGVRVIIGGPYNSGLLASDLSEGSTYNYAAPPPPEVLARARGLKATCDRHAVPLKAAALQFVLAHPAVASVIPGPRSVGELEENFRMAQHPIPKSLWSELREGGLIDPAAPTPG